MENSSAYETLSLYVFSLKRKINECKALKRRCLIKIILGIIIAFVGSAASLNDYYKAVAGYNGGRYSIYIGVIIVGFIYAGRHLSNFYVVNREEKEAKNKLDNLSNRLQNMIAEKF